MIRPVILCCLICLAATDSFSQTFKELYSKADYYFNLEQPSLKTDSIAASLFTRAADGAFANGDYKIGIESFIKAGSIHQTHKRYVQANDFYRKAISKNGNSVNDTSLFYQAYLYLGSSYHSLGNTDSATVYFERASTLSIFHPQSADFPEQERLYNSLGTIYFESANYQQAKNYFEKALRTIGSTADTRDESVVTLQSNIANCMLQLRQYPEAIKIFRQLLLTRMQSRVISHNLAHAYSESKHYDSSLYFFGKVSRQNDIVTVRMLNDLGRIYTEQHQWSRASAALDSSLTIINSLFEKTKNRDRTSNYLLRSVLAEKRQQPNEALMWSTEAIKEVHFRFKPTNIYDVPVEETETLSPITFLELLQQKARLLENRYRITDDRLALDACFRTHLLATHTASYIRRCFDNDEAKMYFQQDKSAVYHDALRIAHELTDRGGDEKYIDGLLEINEGYKGSIVYENIRHLDLSARVKLPAWVIEKEKTLKRSLAFLTTQLNMASSPMEAKRIHENLVTTNVELSRLLALYDRDRAYQLFRNQRVPGLHSFESISGSLDDETAIISFNVTHDNVYALAVTKQGYKTHSIARDSLSNANFKSFIEEVYSQEEGRRYTGYKPGYELYKSLLAPLLPLTGSKKHWVIMPDDFLSYIPFDALCVNPGGREYLIFNRQISYHYSFSLLMLNLNEEMQNVNARTLFFAPFTKETASVVASGLTPLPFSATEATGSNIVAKFSTEATKANWLSSIEGATTLHLATHATTGNGRDSTAMINFYPIDTVALKNNLYVDEIYRLNMQRTGLVVLSACETAGGASTSGEGLLSLSRAFLYAGAKGIVSSLWKSEDGVSAYLMRHMYTDMENGYTTEAALRRAKLAFLRDDGISARYKTPNYWGNFVYVGRVKMNEGESYFGWWIAGGVFVAVVMLVWAVLAQKATLHKTG